MVSKRFLLVVAIISMFALAGHAWCGGLNFAGGKLNVGAGYMSVRTSGVNGASPQEPLDSSNSNSGFTGDASYQTDGPSGTQLTASGNYSMVNTGGDVTGVVGSGNSNMDLKLWNVNGDIGFNSGAVGFGGSSLTFGPRLQIFGYSDLFRFDNGTLNISSSRNRSYMMFGIGGFGSFAIPALAVTSQFGNISPKISFAGSVGATSGQGMRYTRLEAYLQIFDKAISAVDSQLKAEVGWIWMGLKENADQIGTLGTVIGVSNADFQLNIPVIKANLSF